MKIAIVIPCYKRVDTLKDLYNSLIAASYGNQNVDLIYSIDYSGNDDVYNYTFGLTWPHGNKYIIKHEKNIGLRENIISCGNLTKQYDAVILLEDDLEVCPSFFLYAVAAAEYYDSDPRIAGISLYQYKYEEITRNEFNPIYEGGDTYFMQWTSSWGQLWTRKQWKSFMEWYPLHEDISNINIPSSVKSWKRSWKKYNIAYLVDTNKYYVYPFESYTFNGDKTGGDHTTQKTISVVFTSSPLNYFVREKFTFAKFDDAKYKYDVYFQLFARKIKVGTQEYDVEFDLYGHKESVSKEYIVTSRKCEKNSIIHSFSCIKIPAELNVLSDNGGNIFHLIRSCDFDNKKKVPSLSYLPIRRIAGAKQLLVNGLYKVCQRLLMKIK